jgi:putative redox protein
MRIQLQRAAGQPLAQTIRIGGHALVADGSDAAGGTGAGPSPHDLYDAALGACKAITVLFYARRKGMQIDEIVTEIQRDDSEERSGTYRLAANMRIHGQLTDDQIEELASVAERCPVHKLMTSITQITTAVQRA